MVPSVRRSFTVKRHRTGCIASHTLSHSLAAPNTYGVYIIHLFVVLALQLLMLSIIAPALLKFALVTVAAVLASFALTAFLRQLPWVRAVV